MSEEITVNPPWRAEAIRSYHRIVVRELIKAVKSSVTVLAIDRIMSNRSTGLRKARQLRKVLAKQAYDILRPPFIVPGRPRRLSSRDEQIIILRAKKWTWGQIGKEFGISRNAAQQAHKRALAPEADFLVLKN